MPTLTKGSYRRNMVQTNATPLEDQEKFKKKILKQLKNQTKTKQILFKNQQNKVRQDQQIDK